MRDPAVDEPERVIGSDRRSASRAARAVRATDTQCNPLRID
jgi:hypothetical protein